MDTTKGVAIGSAVSAVNVEPNHSSIVDSNDNQWLIVSKRDSTSRLLPKRMIFVGRLDCDICVPSTTVDMRHAVLFFNGHHFHIKDLNSAYGTYVNDKRIAGQCYVRLQHSDRLRFGFGPDLFIIEKISSLPLTTNIDCDLQLISGDIESIETSTQMDPQIINEIVIKAKDNPPKESDPISRLINENNSNSSLSNSADSLDEIKSIKPKKDSKCGIVSDKKQLNEINEEIKKDVTTGSPQPTGAPDSLGSVDSFCAPTAFIITLDDDNDNNKKMSIRDGIRKFAPPKPDSIEKPRPSKPVKNESNKCTENLFANRKSPTNVAKRQTNALTAQKMIKTNKTVETPTHCAVNAINESGGHLSDSATYLINRMLSNRKTDEKIPTEKMRPNLNITSAIVKTNYGEKADSGLSDDIKSDSGNTYTVDDNNEEVENARKNIDQVFGVDDSATVSLNSSPNSSLKLNSPTLLMNFEESLSKMRRSYGSPKSERKNSSNDSEMKSHLLQNLQNSTFTRTKRRAPTAEEMLHQIDVKLSDNNRINNSHIFSNDLNQNKSNSSHINSNPNPFSSKNDPKINNQSNCPTKPGVSHSAPSTPRSPLTSRRLIELRKNSRQNQMTSNGNQRKNSWTSDLDYCESYNSDESTDHSHRSSNSAISKDGGSASGASISGKIMLNRTFALRRARLGIETPGIDVNISKNSSSGIKRTDGGRFSLRVKKDDSKRTPNRISTKEKSNNVSVQRKGSDPFGSVRQPTNRSQSVISSVSDTDRRNNTLNTNRLNQLNQKNLRNNSNFNNNSNVSKYNMNCRQNSIESDSATTLHRSVGKNDSDSEHKIGAHLSDFSPNIRRIERSGNMSSSLTEPSHKPPVHSFQPRNSTKSGLELTALDGLVVSAINQLSHKLKKNLTDLMESQRSKHPNSSHIRNMIDEVLPQMMAPERRVNDNTISVSRDLSSILKNLKKIEQSFEVVSHLLEPNNKEVNSYRKQSNDFFVVDV